MGEDKYGDCMLVQAGEHSILIDGAHPRDLSGQADTPSVPEQLETLFGHPAPFPLTLVVVTHGHNDHIGCLPEMIAQGIVTPRFALVSDPSHCFPPGARDAVALPGGLDPLAASALRRTLAGLAEEDHSDLTERELALFLDRVVKLGARYRAMVEKLEQDDVPVFRWGTSAVEDLQPLYEVLDGTGFDVIAPSIAHLELCRDQIVRYSNDAADVLRDVFARAPAIDQLEPAALAARLYRGVPTTNGDASFAIDRAGQGSALNCQSIMLVIGEPGNRVLLTGDMQFAEHEVRGLDDHMADLLRQVVEAGPYRCLKLPHHSSYNGITPALWEMLGRPPLVVHSGGSNDPSHPEPSVLAAFAEIEDDISFLRTDRNGMISIDLTVDDGVRFSRGTVDDFSRNRRRRDDEEASAVGSSGLAQANPPPRQTPSPTPPPSTPNITDERVEVVVVRLPLGHELKIGPNTIEVRKSLSADSPATGVVSQSDPSLRLAAGRSLPPLLFVTSGRGLASNIGEAEAKRALALISGEAKLLDVGDSADPVAVARSALALGDYAGVVLVGGYDILPSQRVDVLDAALKMRITPSDLALDPDDFIVWSDDSWGDINGDGMADIPVSRIPDGRSAELVMRALAASGEGPDGAFGIRNAARPFADAIFSQIAHEPALKCSPTHVSHIPVGAAAKRRMYFMLHGDDRDGARYWGDDLANRSVVEAINVSALPTQGLDVIFAGCCWGALTVLQRANRPDAQIAPRSPEESIPLACLRSGARAFIGCTGVHYSPGSDGGFFGAPMHKAFWEEIVAGRHPAEALFRARATYLRDMPHNRVDPLEIAIERKIYKQFTCLGLGW
jgi:Predicted hydrolase (metallo-beta-lactamase superfamily)